MSMFQKSLFFLFLCSSVSSFAQIQLIELGPHNPHLAARAEEGMQRRGPVCPEQTLSLPFFDDFSRLDSFYPSCERWLDRQVFVNSGFAYNPPTVGVATFDGLDEFGAPYNRSINTAISYPADTLCSQPLDLSGLTVADNVILSYFYQPQGYGDRPEPDDSLILEFKRNDGEWIVQRSYEGVATNVSSLDMFDFEEAFIALEQEYLYNGFQFRFRNRAAISGNNDHWNIDYVYLDRNRDSSGNYQDVAFTEIPASPLQAYSSVPWRHFLASMWRDSLNMRQNNLSALSGTLDREFELFSIDDAGNRQSLSLEPIAALTYGPSPNANDERLGSRNGIISPFVPSERIELESEYRILNPTDFQNAPAYFVNDTVRRRIELHNYFAYDDGMAESRIIAQGVGTMVGLRFLTTVDDTIRGLYIHMPHFVARDSELDFINLKVWVADLENEAYSRDIFRLRYIAGFNGFYYVPLVDFFGDETPVAVSANTPFYVGWQQASTTPVPIGFDRNNLEAMEHTFVKPNGQAWQQSDLPGAIMIRPLMSIDPVPLTGLAEQENRSFELRVWPNPVEAGQVLHIDYELPREAGKYTWRLLDLFGRQLINYPAEQKQVLLPQGLSASMYILELYEQNSGRSLKKQSIIIR